MIPFFKKYSLEKTVPLAGITSLPTPIERMAGLENEFKYKDIFIKRDDLINPSYGGNKVRKLDFLLADALKKGYTEVMTFGYAGSNHCTATAVHAHKLGLNCSLVLLPQIPSKHLCGNLLSSLAHKANIIYCKVKLEAQLKVGTRFILDFLRRKKWPYLIEAGGSQAVGVLGFVNAIFELKAQVEQGLLPEPATIYVPCSSLGTIIGMAIGLQLTGLKTQIQAIKVVDDNYSNEKKVRQLYKASCDHLQKICPDIPPLDYQKAPLTIRHEFYSGTYAKPTKASEEATQLAQKHLGIELENTYSAHALAALVQDLKDQTAKGPLLYWNTFNSANLNHYTKNQDYKMLPPGLHYYFN